MKPESSQRFKLIAAFAAVYVIWGSTYLAIGIGISTIPPLMLGSVRFLISGPLLLLYALFTGSRLPTKPREYLIHFSIGSCLLLGGNGGVVLAEQYLSTGFTSLIVATVPFWMVGIEWLWKKGEKPRGLAIVGILLGFGGVLFLIFPDLRKNFGSSQAGDHRLFAELLLLGGSVSWAFGSILSKHSKTTSDTIMATALQMVFGGIGLGIAAGFRGEIQEFQVDAVSRESVMALIYLIIFGSCIGFTSYAYMLKHAPAAKVATYAYVNPVVAVLIGYTLYAETLNWNTVIGMAIILFGVFLVGRAKIQSSA